MKAWLCAGLAATASGFGSLPGEEGRSSNPCANPNAFTPDGTLRDAPDGNANWQSQRCTDAMNVPAAGACLDMLLEADGETETSTTRQEAFAWWAKDCCNDQVPICCGDDDISVARDTVGAVASCAAGLAQYNGVCSDDMYAPGAPGEPGAPSGWFKAKCPASCGAC